MTHRRLMVASLAPAGLLAGVAAAAPANAPTLNDNATVLERMAQLESEVSRLQDVERELARVKAATGLDIDEEARAAEVHALVADALADADARTSFRRSSSTGGWDNGFHLTSADGHNKLNINGLTQFRYVHSLRDNSGDDSVGAFENRRTFLTFSGHVVDSTWIYKIQGGFANGGTGDFALRDAYVAKAMDNGLIVAAGQVKVPLQREAYIDESGDLGAARSVIDAEFDAGYTQGVAFIYPQDQMKYTLALTDGHSATGGPNGAWNAAGGVDYSITGRIDYMPMGEWSQFDDMTSKRGSNEGLLIGAFAHWQGGESGTPAGEIDAFQGGVDVSWEGDGFNLYGQWIIRDVKGVEADTMGIMVQGGYYMADDLELYGRFEYGDREVEADPITIFTVGVNKYFADNVKFSADFGYAFETITASWGAGGVGNGSLGRGGATEGFQTDAAGEDGQIVLRAQLQLGF